MSELENALSAISRGDRRAITRAMTLIENDLPGGEQLMEKIHPLTGGALRVGVTGPPGSGKSSLCAELSRLLREHGKTVGIVAVDPTSPFSGGALLGDRIRLTELSADAGVFVRSMASRGEAGGLALKAQEVADVLDAAGKDWLLLETVGVGQTEFEIAGSADLTVVVLTPEAGDSIQGMKAGLMEIADIFVINKSDRPGAARLRSDLEMTVHMHSLREGAVERPILMTSAQNHDGVGELLSAIEKLHDEMRASGAFEERRKKRLYRRIRHLIDARLRQEFWTTEREQLLEKALSTNRKSRSTPRQIAESLLSKFLK